MSLQNSNPFKQENTQDIKDGGLTFTDSTLVKKDVSDGILDVTVDSYKVTSESNGWGKTYSKLAMKLIPKDNRIVEFETNVFVSDPINDASPFGTLYNAMKTYYKSHPDFKPGSGLNDLSGASLNVDIKKNSNYYNILSVIRVNYLGGKESAQNAE